MLLRCCFVKLVHSSALLFIPSRVKRKYSTHIPCLVLSVFSIRWSNPNSNSPMRCRNGKHVLVAYIMKPKAGYDYLATAAHFAAESSTGTNVNVCTTDDFTKSVDALVYYIDPDNEEMKIAYPTLLFDRNITDGRGMMCSFLTLAIGNNQGSLAINS